VTRNRVKRLIKEAYRLNSDNIPKGYDLVFVARVRMKDANYKTTENTMRHLLKRIGE
jgi:ribonuclease P protein component